MKYWQCFFDKAFARKSFHKLIIIIFDKNPNRFGGPWSAPISLQVVFCNQNRNRKWMPFSFFALKISRLKWCCCFVVNLSEKQATRSKTRTDNNLALNRVVYAKKQKYNVSKTNLLKMCRMKANSKSQAGIINRYLTPIKRDEYERSL